MEVQPPAHFFIPAAFGGSFHSGYCRRFFPDFVLGISAFLTARMYHLISDILQCVILNILKSSQNLEVFIVRCPGGLPKGWGLF